MNHGGFMKCYHDFRCINCMKYCSDIDTMIGNCFKKYKRKKRKATPKNTMNYKIASILNFGGTFIGTARLEREIRSEW